MKKIYRVISLVLILSLTFALAGCSAALKEAAKLSEYEAGDDRIPSITSVVGEREVTDVEVSTKNGVVTKQYTYLSTSVYDDLFAYVTKLMQDDWLVTQDIDLNVVPGSGELGRNSKDEGQIVLLSFSYEEGGYTVQIVKGKGTIE